MGVSKNRGGPPKSSISIRVFHDFHHPFWGTPISIIRKINGWNISSWRFGSDDFPFQGWVICRFQPLIFQGVDLNITYRYVLFVCSWSVYLS